MFQQHTTTNNKWLLHKENGPKLSSLRSMACFSLAIISPHLIELLCSKFKTFYSAPKKGDRFSFSLIVFLNDKVVTILVAP